MPSKLPSAVMGTACSKCTSYLRLMPLTLSLVSPRTPTLMVLLTSRYWLKTVKASRSRISVNWLMLTAVMLALVTEGNETRAKAGCAGVTSARYMSPSKASMTAWMLSSAEMVALMASVKLFDCVCDTWIPSIFSFASSIRCWAILGMATNILGVFCQ